MRLPCAPPDLERGATPAPAAPRRLWALAFYAPALALPMLSRAIVLVRDGADLGLASALKGGAFGAMQDAAVLLQTLVAVRAVVHGARAAPRWLPRLLVRSVAALLLSLLYAWLTLACALDLTLLVRFLPRLNRGFVQMYLRFSSQFASSLHEVCTPQLVLGALAYVASMALWVTAVAADKVQLPRFSLLVCETATPPAPESVAAKPAPGAHRRVSVRDAGVLPWLVHVVTTSVALRTIFVALLVFASALHATLALDGNGHDIYLLSNAMFSLETENVLRAASSPSVGTGAAALQHQHALLRGITQGHATSEPSPTTEPVFEANATASAEHEETQPPLSPFYERTLGRTELFELASDHASEFPFWRTTRKFTGKKRFAWAAPRDDRPPPTVILINLESFRSLEVGVLGGRDKVAQYNQTVTPFFDSLAHTGVLFAKHYTPCVQTSRTLLSGIFGILPSLADASAVSTFGDTKLRLYGLPQILKKALNYTSTFWSAVNLAWEDWRGFLKTNGFDTLVDDDVVLDHLTKEQYDALTDDDAFSWGRHDAVSFDALTNFLREHQPRRADAWAAPVFLDVYTVSSHDPWSVPSTFVPSTNYSHYVTSENEKYVNALNYVDQCLDKFITTLRREGLMDNTIMLIQGDHGYGRMEHGDNPTIVASWVYDVGTHVPMMLLADDLLDDKDKGLVVEDLTSQTDMLATITDMLGIENFQQHGVGQSMLREQSPEREVVLSNPFYGQTRGLRVGDLKYARYGSGKYEVYNLTADPHETAPMLAGKLTRNEGGGVHIGADLDATTANALRYMEEIEDVVQILYETNGFMPSPEALALTSAPSADDDPHRKKIADVVHPKTDVEATEGNATDASQTAAPATA